jgi:hypothetical protein
VADNAGADPKSPVENRSFFIRVVSVRSILRIAGGKPLYGLANVLNADQDPGIVWLGTA